MYTGSGVTTGATSHLVHYTIATASGQSGSPIYRTDATGTYIEAVLSYGRPADVTVSYDNGASGSPPSSMPTSGTGGWSTRWTTLPPSSPTPPCRMTRRRSASPPPTRRRG